MPNRSEALDKLLPDLIALQGALDPVTKDDINEFANNHKFASLGAIVEAIRPLLLEHGFCMTHRGSVLSDGGAGLVSTLWHKSGQFLEGEFPLLLAKEDPQGQGSAITYMRRYATCAMLEIIQHDDDGQRATEARQASRQTQPARKLPSCIHCGSADKVMISQYSEGYYCKGCKGKFKDADLEVEDQALAPY